MVLWLVAQKEGTEILVSVKLIRDLKYDLLWPKWKSMFWIMLKLEGLLS
jgi:hypothetical protein